MTAVIIFILLIFVVISLFGASSYKVGNEAEEKMKKTLMVNRDFQDELVKKISDPKYKKQILELISEDLKYIYGDAWEELYLNQPWYLPKPYTTVFDSKENIILFLMLSKSGLIPECYRFSGIQITNTSAVNIYEALRTLHCVEKNIQQKKDSLDYKLIFNPKITRDGYGKHAGPEVARYDLPFMGSFHWSFESFYYNSRFVMRDIHNATLVTACKNCSIGERSDKEKNNPYKNKLTL